MYENYSWRVAKYLWASNKILRKAQIDENPNEIIRFFNKGMDLIEEGIENYEEMLEIHAQELKNTLDAFCFYCKLIVKELGLSYLLDEIDHYENCFREYLTSITDKYPGILTRRLDGINPEKIAEMPNYLNEKIKEWETEIRNGNFENMERLRAYLQEFGIFDEDEFLNLCIEGQQKTRRLKNV